MTKTRNILFSTLLLGAVLLAAAAALADTSVSWVAPPDGSVYAAGTTLGTGWPDGAITGQASSAGWVGGTGLDLALVLDSSGSMNQLEDGTWASGDPHNRLAYQAAAAHALVDALPVNTTSVAIIEFDSDANTVRMLSDLISDMSAIHSAIDQVDASGATNIGSGIAKAAEELTSTRHTAGRAQMMVVMSDGYTSNDPEAAALSAIASGIDAIHTVGLPGHDSATMRDIVDGVDDAAGTSDDYGVYTDVTDLSTITGIFDGTAGNLVGLDHVDIQLADGSWINDIGVDGLGNFMLPDQVIALGANTFTAYAFGLDGTSAMATLTLNGSGAVAPVPEPATMLLMGIGLGGLGVVGRKKVIKS